MKSRRELDILYSVYKILSKIRYGSESHWPKVSLGHSTSSYFTGGPASVGAFANVLNKLDPMKVDEVLIHPDDIRHAAKISQIYSAVISLYKKKGFTVTP